MLNKTLINYNTRVLKREKDRLLNAIESCESRGNKYSFDNSKHIEKLKKEVSYIDRIIEYFKTITSQY